MNRDWLFCLRAGNAPAGVAEVSVSEELEGTAACAALEVMLNDVGGPICVEEVLQGTCALGKGQLAVVYSVEKPTGEFEILARLVEAEALHEPVTLSARSHCMSVPLWSMSGSHAEGAGVMLPKSIRAVMAGLPPPGAKQPLV